MAVAENKEIKIGSGQFVGNLVSDGSEIEKRLYTLKLMEFILEDLFFKTSIEKDWKLFFKTE